MISTDAKPLISVVAAVLTHQGKLLITRRVAGKQGALQWEFPGGKVEAGESLAAALQRELQEELNIRVWVLDELFTTFVPGETRNIQLHFLRCRLQETSPEPQPQEGQTQEWCERKHLGEYDFLAPDRAVIAFLSHSEIGVSTRPVAMNQI